MEDREERAGQGGGARRKLALSPAMEDYLRAIWDLGGGAEGEPVATTHLARRMDVAPASVTGMIKRLAGLGLVLHERYAGARLSPLGERVALEVIRHHRIIETYLAEALGVGWDEVHDEAHRLEHHISDALGERMAEALGHPERDPHGAPIPPSRGPFVPTEYLCLSAAQPGDHLVVREVVDEDGAVLRQLDGLGLRPDVELRVVAVDPGGAQLRIDIDGRERHVTAELAAAVSVAAFPGS